ncbi:hypothetical protein L195_g054889, partial [Trifolium pratense]
MEEVNLDNLNLIDDEPLDFELEEDSAEQNDITLCLVGHFVHDRPINFNSMKTRLDDVWRPVKSMAVTKGDRTQPAFYLNSFKCGSNSNR